MKNALKIITKLNHMVPLYEKKPMVMFTKNNNKLGF